MRGLKRKSERSDKAETLTGGRITALEAQVRDPDRISIFIEDQFACGISGELVEQFGLSVGAELTDEDLKAIVAASEMIRARNLAYLLLSYRVRSVTEVKRRLIQKGFDASIVRTVTEEMAAAGSLDDDAFAKAWVRNRMENRPRGKTSLRWELRQKGVSREKAEAALEGVSPDTEIESARNLALQRWERERNADPDKRRQRVIGLLQRRGYNWETIREALSSLVDEVQGDKSEFDDDSED
jgi:regulatory protein